MRLTVPILISLVVVGSFGIVNANDFSTYNSISPNFCIDKMNHGMSCFEYTSIVNGNPQTAQSPPTIGRYHQPGIGWIMDIIAPDGTCNISGSINSNGGCTANPIVLSNTDFNTLKTNISVLAVVNIKNSAMTPQNYCPVAIWTWGTQDATFQAKYNKTLVVPVSCNPQPIPEFPFVSAIILLVSISAILILGFRYAVLHTPLSEI